MGKWTPNFTDDVLHAKISNLVSGSIRRAAVEKEPSITYENFVEDLDTGDSFTASLIDILVKELADRRTRPNSADRRYIADRTIRSLRMLASNTRSAAGRFGRPAPRRVDDYFATSPNEMDMEEEDEYEVAMENPTTIVEGARLNTDLYDALTPSSWAQASSRRVTESPPVSDEWPLPPLIRSPASSNRPWSANNAAASTSTTSGASNLTRQASIRPRRSRMVDFHEYTQRRRSNARDAWPGARPEEPESVTEPREGPTTATVRRFFPFPRARRPVSSVNPVWMPDVHGLSPDSDESSTLQYYSGELPGWVPPYLTHSPLGASPDDTESREETENLLRAPRLRRGGIRAPEEVLSRRASPIPMPPATISTTSEPATSQPSTSPRRDEGTSASANEEPVAYPTPGSTENENLSS